MPPSFLKPLLPGSQLRQPPTQRSTPSSREALQVPPLSSHCPSPQRPAATSERWSVQALTAAGRPAGFLRQLWAHAGRSVLEVAAAVEGAVAARSFARSVPRGIYPRLDEPQGPRDTLPTRLSAQYLINRLFSFRLRLIESFRDGNPSVPKTSGPNWVWNDAILGKWRSLHPIPSVQSSSVCWSDAPSPLLLRNAVPWHLKLLIKIEQSDSFLGLPQLFRPLRRQDKLHF